MTPIVSVEGRISLFPCAIASLMLSLALLPHSRGIARAASMPTLELESRSTVFVYPHRDPYDLSNRFGFSHAPSVATMPDGRLLCVWFAGPHEASVHQVILASFSSDQGRTWESAFVLQDQPRASDFDPALVVDGDRVWFFYVYGRWNRYPFMQGPVKGEGYVGDGPDVQMSEKAFIGAESYHLYARYSDDSGKTWSKQRKIHESAGCRSNGIKLTSGELLLPAHDFRNNWTESYVMKSDDHGKTWARAGKIVNPSGVDEPTIAELKNGDVLIALRTGDSHLWTCRSSDKGETWAEPFKHDMLAGAASHNLFRTSGGHVVLTHDECKAGSRTPLAMRATLDGKTWGPPLELAESLTPLKGNDYWGCQVTYPSVCEVPGNVLVVVWARINMSNTEQYGEIHAARIKVGNADSK